MQTFCPKLEKEPKVPRQEMEETISSLSGMQLKMLRTLTDTKLRQLYRRYTPERSAIAPMGKLRIGKKLARRS